MNRLVVTILGISFLAMNMAVAGPKNSYEAIKQRETKRYLNGEISDDEYHANVGTPVDPRIAAERRVNEQKKHNPK